MADMPFQHCMFRELLKEWQNRMVVPLFKEQVHSVCQLWGRHTTWVFLSYAFFKSVIQQKSLCTVSNAFYYYAILFSVPNFGKGGNQVTFKSSRGCLCLMLVDLQSCSSPSWAPRPTPSWRSWEEVKWSKCVLCSLGHWFEVSQLPLLTAKLYAALYLCPLAPLQCWVAIKAFYFIYLFIFWVNP